MKSERKPARVICDTAPVSIARRATDWQLTCSQWVPGAIEDVFAFFAAPGNLERLTPPFLRFRILHAPRCVRTGSLIEYRLRLHGLPVWWRTRIEDWTPPHQFVDVQLRGPFRRWHHHHEFLPSASGTLIKDTVVYDLYCRALHRTPALAWIDRDLRRIFTHRQRQVAEIFGGGGWTSQQAPTEQRRDGEADPGLHLEGEQVGPAK